MSNGKRISAFATATVMALSMVGYFPMGTTHATNASCAENAYTLSGNELGNLQDGETYTLSGDASGDLTLNGGAAVTLDLAGCTLNGKINVYGGSVTVTDSSADKTGAVTGGTHSTSAQTGQNGALVVRGGEFTKPINPSAQYNSGVSLEGGRFPEQDFVSSLVANGYGAFAIQGGYLVEEILTEDNVSFPGDIEMSERETKDFIVAVEPGSELLHVDYNPVSNDYFEIVNGKISAKKAGESEVKVTVKQGENLVAEKTISVKIYEVLQWVEIEDWDNNSYYPGWQVVYPTGGNCMGYRALEAGETFNLNIKTNLTNAEPEISVEAHGESWYDDGGLTVASIDENGNLVAENSGWATVVVTATYNGRTVVAHGHILVNPTAHEIVEGNGAEYSGDKLTQKIDADYTKLREVYICPLDAYNDLIAKYGSDESSWGDEAWAEYHALEDICNTPVDPSNYEVTKGSTVVTFANAWLDTLALGEYDVWYDFTDGYANGTFVISSKKLNEVEIVSNSVAVGDTGLMTAPVNEGVRSTLGGTIVAVVAAVMAGFVAVFAKRRARK